MSGPWMERARQGEIVEVLGDERARIALSPGEEVTAGASPAMVRRWAKLESGDQALLRPTADGSFEVVRARRLPADRNEPMLVPADDPGVEYLVRPGEMRWQQPYLPYLYDWYDPFDDDLPMWRRLAGEEEGPVLELACGTGRIVNHLAAEGHEVTGVDISQAMLDRAAEKLAERAPEASDRVELVCSDMGLFSSDRRYGLAYIACNSLHYMTPVEHRERAIGVLFEHLRPGGLGVISNVAPVTDEPAKPRRRATHMVMGLVGTNPNTGLWTVEYRGTWYDSSTGTWYEGPWRFVEELADGSRRTIQFSLPPELESEPPPIPALTRDETVALMRRLGFRDVEVRSAHDLGPVDDSKRVVVFSGRA